VVGFALLLASSVALGLLATIMRLQGHSCVSTYTRTTAVWFVMVHRCVSKAARTDAKQIVGV
jgi:hypothetical protein